MHVAHVEIHVEREQAVVAHTLAYRPAVHLGGNVFKALVDIARGDVKRFGLFAVAFGVCAGQNGCGVASAPIAHLIVELDRLFDVVGLERQARERRRGELCLSGRIVYHRYALFFSVGYHQLGQVYLDIVRAVAEVVKRRRVHVVKTVFPLAALAVYQHRAGNQHRRQHRERRHSRY